MRDGLPVVGEKLARPSLRSFVVLVALVFGVVGAANGYTQPVAIAVVQNPTLTWLPVFGNEGLATSLNADLPVSAATGVGPLYASFAAVGAVVSYYAGRIESRLGLRRSLVGLATVLVVTLAALLLVPVIALGTVYLLKSVQHLLRPMVGRYLNDRVEDVCRATVLSAVSMVFGIARTPFVILAGIAARAAGPVTAFPALAGLFLLAVLPLVLVGSPLPAATEQRLGTRPRQ
jgi:MFS family permease